VIPESIGNIYKVLSQLYMGGNHIYGNIPASFSHLSGLNLLNLSYNSPSSEIPPEIGCLEELQELLLGKNLISGSIPNSLGS
jgi:Leucine-rich repeat (LRR) protein